MVSGLGTSDFPKKVGKDPFLFIGKIMGLALGNRTKQEDRYCAQMATLVPQWV
jgi:hypothetical protein